ncbi:MULTISPECIES: helix-turn-helix domain-containing protein [Streptomyces]|uniref:helix-turn-helix domain-containing protein n=1 Tax=Streptomyces TaxID=1883 RepID=UPI0019375432|nr:MULTISPECIES: helix-turn-helix domain-containing protein [unclassified Streptomyces]MCU4746995.1 helix-turn-helix domain-containing protein [Streptomyces sp. G-5]QQN81215.1 helix-turn-helix domain-containing protein [Streptomyces sp. XC 2026]
MHGIRTDDPVGRAVACVRERYAEPLTLADLADSAGLSRFHFARLFKETTGITPGRFLAAVRLHRAKRLLLSTSLNIADVSAAVGYVSLGSFTTSFTVGVGISPGRFRRLSRAGGPALPAVRASSAAGRGAVAGTVSLPDGHGNARVYIGAFGTPIVEHPSLAGVLVDVPGGRPSCYHLPDVPAGTWYVHAVAVADGVGPDPRAHRTPLIGGQMSVTVTAGSVTSSAVRLRRVRPTDPPVLLALPDLVPPRAPAVSIGCPALTPRPAASPSGARPLAAVGAPRPS